MKKTMETPERKELRLAYKAYTKYQQLVQEQIESMLPYNPVVKWMEVHNRLVRAVKGVIDAD